MRILRELHEIKEELQKIREILEFSLLPQYKVEIKEGRHVRVPLDREAALKELHKQTNTHQ